MKLEEEINVNVPFEDERHKAIVNLAYTYNVFLEKTQTVLKTFGINDQHYNILKTLQDHRPEPLAVGAIKKALLNKRGDLTRLLDKLNDMGLVVREVNPENRRVVNVTLSECGEERLKEMDAKLSVERDRRKNLSKEEARQLNELLDKLRD